MRVNDVDFSAVIEANELDHREGVDIAPHFYQFKINPLGFCFLGKLACRLTGQKGPERLSGKAKNLTHDAHLLAPPAQGRFGMQDCYQWGFPPCLWGNKDPKKILPKLI
jgi:hypothetical protein